MAALHLPDSYYRNCRPYIETRDLLSYLDPAGLTYTRPQGAYYVLVDISEFGGRTTLPSANGWHAR